MVRNDNGPKTGYYLFFGPFISGDLEIFSKSPEILSDIIGGEYKMSLHENLIGKSLVVYFENEDDRIMAKLSLS